MNYPPVAVLIPTFNRASIVTRTVDLLLTNLQYSGDITIYVGCDGEDETPAALAWIGDAVKVLARPSGGIGRNLNRLIKLASADRHELFFSLDDDHHLVTPLCLDRHVKKLVTDTRAGWIHLLMEARGDESFDHYKFTASLDPDHYWRVDWNSEEHFIMSFRPHLFHKRFIDVFGYLPEDYKTGATEWQYAAQVKAIGVAGGGVDVLVPLRAYDAETWEHNNGGVSWNRLGL